MPYQQASQLISLACRLGVGMLYPRRRVRFALVRDALCLRPAVNPRESSAANVSFWQRIRGIIERLAQGDERISATLKHSDQVSHQISVHLACMDQQDLRYLATNDFHCALLEERNDGF